MNINRTKLSKSIKTLLIVSLIGTWGSRTINADAANKSENIILQKKIVSFCENNLHNLTH